MGGKDCVPDRVRQTGESGQTQAGTEPLTTIYLDNCTRDRGRVRTGEGGVLSEDVLRRWSKQDEGVNDATFRDPAHVCLGLLIGALHIIKHFPKHSLDRNTSK